MAVSVLEIDVKDEKFKRFMALFQKYQATLNKMPDAWNKTDETIVEVTDSVENLNEKLDATTDNVQQTNDALDGTGAAIDSADKKTQRLNKTSRTVTVTSKETYKNFQAMAAALMSQQETLFESLKNQMKMTQEVGRTTSKADVLERKMKGVARSAKDALGSLLKWSTIMGVGAGLLGVGSLFGLDRLGSSAGASRRSAQGLGISSSEQQAFNINYSRAFDPDSVLSKINEAKLDPAKQWIFGNLGIANSQSKNAAQIGAELPLQAKRIYEQGGQNTQYAQARGLLDIYTVEDLQRLHRMTEQEIIDMGKKNQQDIRSLAVNDDQLRIWQDFTRQLSVAGQKLENTFIRGLSKLAPEIGHFSEILSDTVDKILNSENLKEWIDNLAKWIKKAGDYLSSPQFGRDVAWFMGKLHELTQAVGSAINWFTRTFGGTAEPEDRPGKSAHIPAGSQRSVFGDKVMDLHDRVYGSNDSSKDYAKRVELQTYNRAHGPELQAELARLEEKRGLLPGMLSGMFRAESSDGTDLRPSIVNGKDYVGPFQVGEEFAHDHYIRNRMDFGDSSKGVARGMAGYLDHFKNAEMALAAFNWSPTKMERIKDKPDWKSYLPDETKKYIDKVEARMREVNTGGRTIATPPGGSTVQININNNTGGSAVVSTSQVARQ
jgi:hypothetical protein